MFGFPFNCIAFGVVNFSVRSYRPESAKSSPAKATPKKMKVEVYKLTQEQKALIKSDEPNKKLWDEVLESLSLGPVRTDTFWFPCTWCHRASCIFVKGPALVYVGFNVVGNNKMVNQMLQSQILNGSMV